MNKLFKNNIIKTFLVFIFICPTMFAQKTDYILTNIKYKDKDYTVIENQIGLRIKENHYTDDLHKKLEKSHYKITFATKKYRSIVVQTDGKSDLLEHCLKLETEEYVEAVFPVEPAKLHYSVNDPDYVNNKQYALAKLNISNAWDYTQGDPNLRIAILDSGIPMQNGVLSHDELKDANRILLGFNYVATPPNKDLNDNYNHGSHIAGIIGAKTNNGIGIAGICFGSKLYISRVSNGNSFIDISTMYGVVQDAISNGCKIINMCFGANNDNNNLYKVLVEHADSNNVLIVASAGNNKGGVNYPAYYAKYYSNVIAVSATDENDVFASTYPINSSYGSCFGPEITVCAPGVNIRSTLSPNTYGNETGTSMSAPMVTGVAGLVWSKFPHLSAAQVKKQIELSAEDKGTPDYDNHYGHGRVNAYSAVRYLYVPQIYSTIQNASSYATSGQIILVSSGTYTENLSVTIPAGVTLQIEPGTVVNFNGNLTINGSLIAKGTLNLNSGLIVNGSLTTNVATLNFSNGAGLTINGGANCQHTIFTGYYWSGISINNTGGSSKSFTGCEISNGTYGVNVNGTYVSISSATKIYNTGCAANFTNGAMADIAGNNIFDNNNWDIRADGTSTPNAGLYIGYNSFRRPGYYQFYSTNPSTLYARGNYWQFGPIIEGNIDVSNALPSDINPAMNVQDDHRAEIESELFLRKRAVKNDEPVEKVPGIEELDKARLLLHAENYDETLLAMHELVDKYKNGYVGKSALVFIEHTLLRIKRDKEILPMLEKYSKGKSKVAQYAHYRTGYQYLYQREYDKAITIMKGTEFNEEDSYLKQARLYDLGTIHHDLLTKKAEAYDYFSELVNTYPDCPLAEVVNTFYKITKDGYEKPTTSKEETIITETKLFANYPNPFNPSTVIKYQLSEASLVSLKVYDVMGKEVTTLVNSFQNKGSYDVTFNANGLSSGIYFYKLNANGKQLINKMLLMK
jgi:thermitase